MPAMSLDVTTVGAVGHVAAQHAPDGGPRRARASVEAAPAVIVDTIPQRPPPEVLEAMGAASRALAHMHAHGRELRFAHDEDTGVLSIEVRDLDGNLLRTIPPSKLLDLIASRGTLP
jgi:FlaG protein